MKIALAQTKIEWENKNINYDVAKRYITNAKKESVDLIFFPEMSFTGFSMNIEATAESNFETIERIKEFSNSYAMAIGFGWVKKCGEYAENHYTVIDKRGDVLSDYIKIHPFSYSGEDSFFKAGDDIRVFEYQGIKLITLICYDLRFPELFQVASREADVIVVPANWPQQRSEHWKTLLQARAIENQCYVLGINCVGNMGGLAYSGDSLVVSPDGTVMDVLSNMEGLVIAEIGDQVTKIRSEFPVKRDRKWELYKTMYEDIIGET